METRRNIWAIVVISAALFATRADSGTLCGTVRDQFTQGPVSAAGVFAFESGVYTGIHSATDSNGYFCLDPIPPGLYDLQIKVDDYMTGWITGITVTDDVVSVIDEPFRAAYSLGAPVPNPARGPVAFHFTIPDGSRIVLEVFDLRGSLVYGWTATTSGTASWKLRDLHGRAMPPGMYWLRMRGQDIELARGFLVTR